MFKIRSSMFIASGALFAATLANSAAAQCDHQTLFATDATLDERFGSTGAVDGDFIAAGNPNDDPGSPNAGSVDIFRRVNGQWLHDALIKPDDSAAYDYFGGSVDIDGSYMISSTPKRTVASDGHTRGTVYIWHRENNVWNQVFSVSQDGESLGLYGTWFGQTVAIDGNYALIGAPYMQSDTDNDGNPVQGGQAYVYRRIGAPGNWMYEDTLPSNDPSDYSLQYGWVLAMQHNGVEGQTIAAVGVPTFHIVGESDSGEVLVFTKPPLGSDWGGGWQVRPSDIQEGDSFGCSVAIDGTTMVVGAKYADIGNHPDAGAIYVFQRDGDGPDWIQVQKFTCPTVSDSGQFGHDVAIDGDRILASSPSQQRIEVYRRASLGIWYHEDTIENPSPTDGHIGRSLDLSGSTMLATDTEGDLALFADTGAAYVYELDDENGDDFCGNGAVATAGTYHGCTNYATTDAQPQCAPVGVNPDVWYRYTAPHTGDVTINTFGSAFDTVLSLHDGCPASGGDVIACNDNYGSLLSVVSQVTAHVIGGEQYYVRVSGHAGDTGAFTLNIGDLQESCPADVAPAPYGDGVVDVDDLFMVINNWGDCVLTLPCPANIAPGPGLPRVDVDDLFAVINSWGVCPK